MYNKTRKKSETRYHGMLPSGNIHSYIVLCAHFMHIEAPVDGLYKTRSLSGFSRYHQRQYIGSTSLEY